MLNKFDNLTARLQGMRQQYAAGRGGDAASNDSGWQAPNGAIVRRVGPSDPLGIR
jgi:hypothetical protein